jgi:metal transporter CNNM
MERDLINIFREIIDESDVFVDVHKAIRRLHPAPRNKVPRSGFYTDGTMSQISEDESGNRTDGELTHHVIRRISSHDYQPRTKANSIDLSSSPRTTFLMRRVSGTSEVMDGNIVSRRANAPEIKEHLKHLGPSNLASHPKSTRYNAVKIKRSTTGMATSSPLKSVEQAPAIVRNQTVAGGGIGEGTVKSAGKDASDGAHAVQVGYGTLERTEPNKSNDSNKRPSQPERPTSVSSKLSASTLGSLRRVQATVSTPILSRGARSGSITENVIETGGIRKVILETTSSSSSSEEVHEIRDSQVAVESSGGEDGAAPHDATGSKKKRRRKRKKVGSSESVPLLSQSDE